jgi:CheY-like chemotaxis protein
MPASLEFSPEAPVPAPRPVVLLVDDYAENRRLLEFFLRDRYELRHAASAEEGLEVIASEPIDAAVLDLNLPGGMNGIEAAECIRQDPRHEGIALLAVTAYAYPDHERRCSAAGFDGFIAKPVFKHVILEKLDEVLAARGTAPEGGVWITAVPEADRRTPKPDDETAPHVA